MAVDAVIIGLGYVGLPLAQEHPLHRHPAEQLGAVEQLVGRHRQLTAAVGGADPGTDHPDPPATEGDRAGLGAVPGRSSVRVVLAARPAHRGHVGLHQLAHHLQPGTDREGEQPLTHIGGDLIHRHTHLLGHGERTRLGRLPLVLLGHSGPLSPGSSLADAQHLPQGRRQAGDRHLNFHETRDNLDTQGCGDAAAEFYGRFVDTVVCAKGTREAETAKLLENTYRHINIALVNEMARFCHELGIDLWDVIAAARSKPFGFQAFYPGPGVGGHCIPIDPNYLSHNVRARLGYPFRFVELAQEINSGMPAYVVPRAQDLLNDDRKALRGSTVLLLGVTYKPNIADQRESPAVPLARQLIAKGVTVRYHDPHVSSWGPVGEAATRVEEPAAAVSDADLTILVQNHKEYDVDALAGAARRFFDTRGVVSDGERVSRL